MALVNGKESKKDRMLLFIYHCYFTLIVLSVIIRVCQMKRWIAKNKIIENKYKQK